MKPRTDLHVSLPHGVSDELIADVLKEAKSSGLSVSSDTREPAVLAAIDLLISVVVVLVTQKFLGTLAQKAAEDAYPHLKVAFLRLIDASRRLRFSRLTSSNKKRPANLSSAFSVVYVAEGGTRVQFIFPIDLSSAEQLVALDTLIQHTRHLDSINRETDRPRLSYYIFEIEAKGWVELDLMSEARRRHAQQNKARRH